MASTKTILHRVRSALDTGAAADLDRLVGTVCAPVRIEVTGRAGVGRSALVAALGPVPGAEVVESEAWDRPGATDPVPTGDVVVLTVLDPPRGADRAAADAAGGRLVVVLTKADTLTDPAGAASRAAVALGAPCLPVTAVGAVRGLGEVRDVLAVRVAAVRADRAAALLTLLRSLAGVAGLRDAVEDLLASDDAVWLAASAAGVSAEDGDAGDEASCWRVRLNTASDADSARAALAGHRAAVRRLVRRA
ncbi:hypothetical protein [Rhodococcus sp. NPDC003348]